MPISRDSIAVKKAPVDPQSVPEDAAAKTHHVRAHDGTTTGFKNPYPSWGGQTAHNFFSIFPRIMRMRFSGQWPDTKPPTVTVRKPSFRPDASATDETGSGSDGGKLRATWLGHACYYVEFPSGLRVLFDPVFEDRCAPYGVGPKRFTPAPCAVADLPAVDAVVISHSHYDHLSSPTVREIHRHHPSAHFFVGLGLERWFRRAGVDSVTELDWWEDADLTITRAHQQKQQQPEKKEDAPISARFSCYPAQHTSGRTAFDRDTTLWCSWGVQSGGRSVYFGGDTGYRAVTSDSSSSTEKHESLPACPTFAQVGRLRGPFDLGLLPIGAYHPRSLFSHMHADPGDAVDIFRDVRCRRAMGIHWGTWALTAEAPMEPPALLREALRRRGLPETGVFDVCDIGETREF